MEGVTQEERCHHGLLRPLPENSSISGAKGKTWVSALICITTDLGDSFLAQDVDLIATLAVEHHSKVLHEKSLTWEAGNRQLALSLGPFSSHVAQQKLILAIRPRESGKTQLLSSDPLGATSTPLLFSGWSAPFGPGDMPAEKLVERRLGLKDNPELRIWEETGNSIARHIWDAALASVIYLHQTINGSEGIPSLRRLLVDESPTPLQIVELGAGCGIVGIALAAMLPCCSVLLTDLPEAQEIVTHNINVARSAPMSTIDFRTLDWDEPPDLCGRPIDLILVSDCTYNADSLPALVSVLDRLVRSSPDAIILVALKRRHDSEAIFFELMQSAGFDPLQATIALPSQHDQVDQIELYCYSRAH
ncbi:methyltransferase-domain-containing protein [Penicillium alfredii]|uniref:Methyltransferase-domain-containing protein n=1 Tax=Penicillium alfredii TaxID=1506179 RepID=A0A9W9K8M2_9EURO|nr:methyltransferase-domain-containing protein [Penicillium alfredii]KAJ5096077.1 methyltransferase-domain-containing protein [Penicillium alfredii]